MNGRTAEIGDSVDPKKDTVTVKGKRVRKESSLRYILLNKPRGYVTTTDDELGRKCVTQLVADVKERVYPVGRLDRVSEGALLMTNDGEFANLMMHPSHHVSKTTASLSARASRRSRWRLLSAAWSWTAGLLRPPRSMSYQRRRAERCSR